MKIDPRKYVKHNDAEKKDAWADKPKKITAGKKIMAPVGAALKTRNGKKALEIGSVVIKDLEKNGEEGLMYIDTFYLTEKSYGFIAAFVWSLGWKEIFDPEDLDDMEKVLLSGPFECVFVDNIYNSKTYIKAKYYNETSVERTEEGEPCFSEKELQIISSGEKSWDNILQWRINSGSYGSYVQKFEENSVSENEDEEEIPF